LIVWCAALIPDLFACARVSRCMGFSGTAGPWLCRYSQGRTRPQTLFLGKGDSLCPAMAPTRRFSQGKNPASSHGTRVRSSASRELVCGFHDVRFHRIGRGSGTPDLFPKREGGISRTWYRCLAWDGPDAFMQSYDSKGLIVVTHGGDTGKKMQNYAAFYLAFYCCRGYNKPKRRWKGWEAHPLTSWGFAVQFYWEAARSAD
jgi:hypothetical protein